MPGNIVTINDSIEYYVGDNNDINNKRTHSYEGLKLSGQKENNTFTFPTLKSSSKTLLFVGLGILGMIFFILIGFVIKKLLSEKDIEDMSDYPIQKNDEGTKTIIVDDDISNILNKYQ